MAIETPTQGRIVELVEDSGFIETTRGTRVRFGRSSCSGFEPRVGLHVWVMAIRVVPVIGERASLVNLTGMMEAADPAERARQRYEEQERSLRAQHEAEATRKAAFRDRAREGLPVRWRPGLAALGEVIELPAPLRVLATLDEQAGGRMAERAAQHDAVASALGVDAVFEEHRGDDEARILRVGPCDLWPFQDACLVPFAQLEGEEPDLFALFFHPDLFRARALLPVVYWRHDDTSGLAAADAVGFVAAIAHGRFALDGELLPARPELARLTGLADPGRRVEEVISRSAELGGLPEFPPELAQLVDARADERRASKALNRLGSSDDHAAVAKASEALERRYRELGWRYQERHSRYQRLRHFED